MKVAPTMEQWEYDKCDRCGVIRSRESYAAFKKRLGVAEKLYWDKYEDYVEMPPPTDEEIKWAAEKIFCNHRGGRETLAVASDTFSAV